MDALSQRWTQWINWVNAPFTLLPRVLALLREQEAVAAVVVPRASRARWLRQCWRQAEGVVERLEFGEGDYRCQVVGASQHVPVYKGVAVVFFDFRRRLSPRARWLGWPAEELQAAWLRDKAPLSPPRHHGLRGEWWSGLP